ITGSEIIGNGAASSGGGLLSTSASNLTISSSTFANNHADGGGGGGLYLRPPPPSLGDGPFIPTHVTITGNPAPSGSRILNANTRDNLLRNDTIVFNTATQTGGGVMCSRTAGGLTFANTIVAKNTGGPNPDVDNRGNIATMIDGANNFIGDNTGAYSDTLPSGTNSFTFGTPNGKGSIVGGLTPSPAIFQLVTVDPLLEPL